MMRPRRLALPGAVIILALPGALLHAQQSGDMLPAVPNYQSQPDMFSPRTPQAPKDMFPAQNSAAPAQDLFPTETPQTPADDMLDHADQPSNPDIKHKFSAHDAPPTPPYPLFHNPNEPGP